MDKSRTRRIRNEVESQLSTLMRSVVDARFHLEHARERLRDLEHELRITDPKAYERQRQKALGDYIDAMSKARVARTQLLKQLRERAA
jgi:hypothetical protein